MEEKILVLENMNKKAGNFQLKDISFALPLGYIMGLIGANGAGKTTLLKCILGLTQTDSGCLQIEGMEYDQKEKEIKELLGYVGVDSYFNPKNRIEDLYWLGRFYKSFDEAYLTRLLTEFGLAKNKTIGKLSKGEQLKMQFAFALSHRPKLLIMDEATGSFDPEFREKMKGYMTEFVKDGEHSILFSSHISDEMEVLADYVTMIDHGKILFSMTREELLDSFRIVSGEMYKLKLLKPDRVVYLEPGLATNKAFVRHYEGKSEYDYLLKVQKPTVADVQYYLQKSQENK